MFEISIEQPVLAKALEYLGPTVGKNAGGLGDNCVSMKCTGKGSVFMYTTNTIESTSLEAIVSIGGNSTEAAPPIDYSRLKRIVSSIPNNAMINIKSSIDNLLISFGNNKPLKLVGKSGGMIGLTKSQFPAKTSTKVPKQFIQDALKNVCSILDNSASAPIYNCFRIYTNDLDVEVTAIDITCKRTFVQHGKSSVQNPTNEILVEANKLKKSIKLFEDYNELDFYMNDTLVMIQSADPKAVVNMKTNGMVGNVVYYCRRLSGKFPTNIASNFIPNPTEYMEINKEELLQCFSRVKALEDQTTSNIITFKADNEGATISLNSTAGTISETVKSVNTISKGWLSTFKYPVLSDIIKILSSDTFEIGILPSYPTNYVIKETGKQDVMFTVPSMKTPPMQTSKD